MPSRPAGFSAKNGAWGMAGSPANIEPGVQGCVGGSGRQAPMDGSMMPFSVYSQRRGIAGHTKGPSHPGKTLSSSARCGPIPGPAAPHSRASHGNWSSNHVMTTSRRASSHGRPFLSVVLSRRHCTVDRVRNSLILSSIMRRDSFSVRSYVYIACDQAQSN